ncbi:MAG: hypothetical protein ABEJ55_06525 [Halanaeroarchaeum sp.]
MTDSHPSQPEIERAAARVATTPHPELDTETIDAVLSFVDGLEDRLGEEPADAIADLLAFWDGYALGGLTSAAATRDDVRETTDLRERIERANEADMLGLDLYQGLLKLLDAIDGDPRGPPADPADRTVLWAERVVSLTVDFGSHLDDHR